jgi:hypothetical protein
MLTKTYRHDAMRNQSFRLFDAVSIQGLGSDNPLSVNGARLRVLADIQVIGLLLEARPQRLAAVTRSCFLVQPRQAFLHKPP